MISIVPIIMFFHKYKVPLYIHLSGLLVIKINKEKQKIMILCKKLIYTLTNCKGKKIKW